MQTSGQQNVKCVGHIVDLFGLGYLLLQVFLHQDRREGMVEPYQVLEE